MDSYKIILPKMGGGGGGLLSSAAVAASPPPVKKEVGVVGSSHTSAITITEAKVPVYHIGGLASVGWFYCNGDS